jgi:hypothetical protein
MAGFPTLISSARIICARLGRVHIETLAHDVQEEVLWSVERVTARQTGHSDNFITVYLLDTNRGQRGYKPMEESMHPYCYSCPPSFLDLAPERCPAWRQDVREHQELAA